MKPTFLICAVLALSLCVSVSAQAQTARFDQVHLAATDPAKGVEWYLKYMNTQPWPDDEPFRVKSGDTRVIFRKSADAKPVPAVSRITSAGPSLISMRR